MTDAATLTALVAESDRLQSLYFQVRAERPDVAELIRLAATDVASAIGRLATERTVVVEVTS